MRMNVESCERTYQRTPCSHRDKRDLNLIGDYNAKTLRILLFQESFTFLFI
jgi:hypothetical protein